MKNANQVDFKGGAGISVKGETTKDGVREITISVKDGEVIKPNQFTAKVNGTDTPVTKVGDQYYNTADIDPKTGEPNAKANPVTPDAGTTPTNAGDGYVTGNKVAAAIQKSGFVVGKQKDALSAADFKDEDEKVNPDDELRFADGNNTKVKLATKESVDKDGNKVTTTTVKVDVTGLPVQYTDKNGTPVTKVGDKYFTVDKDGNPTTTEVKPADLTTNMVNPAAKPNEIGAPTTLGNVKSNLPSVNDADKNAKDVDAKPIAGKDNKSAPIDAAKAEDIAKNAGNNAATVSDVLNAGWNLQNNGEAKDFVKPYDTVNFVDGKGTKAVVETTPNGTTSNVKFDIDTGTVTSNKDGSVSGPVTPEMQKALDDAKKALADATTPEAKKTAQDKVDAAQANINNAGNQIATAQSVADAINNSGFTLTTSENGGKKLSGKDELINPGKKVDLAAGKNMTVKQDAEGKVTYATADEVNFSSVQFGDNGPKINAAGDNINIGDKDGNPTKITGVKAGDISPTSTDAVNGAQIYALSRGNVPNVENITVTNPDGSKTTYKDIVVDENGTPILKTYNVQGQKEIITNSVVEAVHNMNEQGIKFFHSNDGVNRPKVETANSFDSSASGKFATAIGKSSVAHGDNAVAMGNGSKVLGNDSIAIGTGNIVEANNSGAFGDPNVIKADATGSYAFGNNNVITTKNTFVLGNDVNNAGNSTSREGTVENSVYLGNKSTATAGDGSRTASLYNIKQDGTKGTSTTAGSVGTVTTATVGNMTYGGFQGAKANGVVSVGAAGDERRIQNVAAGEISSTSTDAINGSQLHAVAKGVGNRINNLQGQVNKLGNRMNAGMATSAAMANLLQAHKPGQSVATAGVGQHKNQSAVAVGYSRLSDNGKYGVRFSMGANTQGEVTGGAAVGYFW
ncbi:YadA-like family protein [uncultured Haemophilus sp.]|uniref:YadA-like family protein n=1 Tax=uncultured Haemophilus sp. TaxID=237779 RepID=UPI00258B933C|nr:YadA-like family protein [uncultured Haemophilus sp.]